MPTVFPFSGIVFIIVAFYLFSSIKILAEYERGVIFRLGRVLPNPKGPGIILVFAPIDRMVRIDLRQVAFDVPPQDIITRDNVTLKVNAVVFLRAMAKQAEAEREKRSKIIHAEGEFSAAQRLVDAAHLLQTEPASNQLRYLQTLTEIGVEKNTTVIFPVPIDLLAGIQKLTGLSAQSNAPAGDAGTKSGA